ncbi:MAG: FliH/SctL family protein [Oscillospiraceae bacterium]|nr:FliH/SctL family protein [Oscillospiraceae bacterium]
MSERVIKAGSTRLLPPEKRPRSLPSAQEAEGTAEAAPPVQLSDGDAYSMAYDEVLEAAQEEVTKLLTDARRQAREVMEQADSEAEKAREAAYAEGLESGREDGYAAALDQTEQALRSFFDEGQREVDKVVAEAYAERDKLLAEMEPKILRLSLDVAEKILGYELDANDTAFISLVTTALNVMRQETRVTLRVSGERHTASFRSKAEAKLKTDMGHVEADIITDSSVGPDGCLIETGSGAVDASVSSQLEQISRNLGLE